jgi:hypothetical protein
MDRLMDYPGQVPLETDLLNAQRFGMIGLGYALQGYLGTGTVVDGFTCTQTAVASTSFLLNPGTIMTLANVDANAFSSLAPDTAHQIIKQGILHDPQTFTPTGFTLSAGQSINILVEVQQADIDGTPIVLPYMNPNNILVAWTGPAGLGATNNTVRASAVVPQLKYGTVAATGTQTTPAVDAGYTPLFVITLPFGWTTITSANISVHPQAPFINAGAKLPAAPASFQNGQWTWAGSFGGTANALTATLSPAPASLVAGFVVRGNIVSTNTGAMTLNVNGLGAVAAVRDDNVAMIGGECVAAQEVEWTYNGTRFVMTSPLPLSFLNTKYLPTIASTSFFVATTGSDTTGDGSAAHPWATIQHAVNSAASFSSAGTVTISVADGTYTGGCVIPPSFIAGWNIVGNITTPANCIINATAAVAPGRGFVCGYGVNAQIQGFWIKPYYESINIQPGATVNVGNLNVSPPVSNTPAIGLYSGNVLFFGTVTLNNGTYSGALGVSYGGLAIVGYLDALQSTTCAFHYGTSTFTVGTMYATQSGSIALYPTQISQTGTVTGSKYACAVNGTINSQTGGINFLSGSIAGNTATGGQYL